MTESVLQGDPEEEQAQASQQSFQGTSHRCFLPFGKNHSPIAAAGPLLGPASPSHICPIPLGTDCGFFIGAEWTDMPALTIAAFSALLLATLGGKARRKAWSCQ